MERLTTRSILGGWTLKVPRQEAVDRLAAYEDTGLEPEEIKLLNEEVECRFLIWVEKHYGISGGELMELVKARDEGLHAWELANQTIGKEVWLTRWWNGFQMTAFRTPQRRTVVYISVLKNGVIQVHVKDGAFPLSEIGKTVFLTHAEAEAALSGGTE